MSPRDAADTDTEAHFITMDSAMKSPRITNHSHIDDAH